MELLKRLSNDDENEQEQPLPTDDCAEEDSNIYGRLKKSLREVNAEYSVEHNDNWKKEFTMYDRFLKRSPKLDLLFDALNSIQPTSTQSERNFSMAAHFVSKLRTRLSDEHVDALSFLKSYFISLT